MVESMKDWVRSWKLVAVVAVLFILSSGATPTASSAQPPAGCVLNESGDLLDVIESISDMLPGPDSNGMVVPSEAQMAAWQQLLTAIEEGELTTACGLIAANGFPYQIVRFSDEGSDGKAYFLLRETLPLSVGWGTYLINSNPRRDVVFEIPHPGCELGTEEEGIQLFRQVDARAFVMAGTHRCANTSYSDCTGTTTFCGQPEPHRTSDVAHATQTMFHAAHQALVVPGNDTVGVQLHGCSDDNCPDVFISNTTCQPGELGQQFYHYARIACQEFSVDLADCTPPECPLVGTTNVQGRFSNGSVWDADFDACTESAPTPAQPQQFLHLEQSHALRDNPDCLAAAFRMTFSDIHRIYVPLILRDRVHTIR
jgi:hypothetical protein